MLPQTVDEVGPYTFSVDNFSSTIKNIDKYAHSFIRHGFFVLNKAYLTNKQAEQILETVGQTLGWSLPPSKNTDIYHQNCDEPVKNKATKNLPDTMLHWRLEGVTTKYPQRAAGWNMHKFSCPPGTGGTGFVDTSKLWQDLPSHHKGFLQNAQIIHFPVFLGDEIKIAESVTHFSSWLGKGNKVIWTTINNELVPSFARNAMEHHPNSGMPCLMVCPCEKSCGPQDFILSVAGKSPSKDHKNQFVELFKWLRKEIDKPENQIWHEWEEGDFLVLDLFRMIHTAQGEFDVEQRAFHENWCFSKNTDHSFQQKIDAANADVEYLNEMCCDPFDENLKLF